MLENVVSLAKHSKILSRSTDEQKKKKQKGKKMFVIQLTNWTPDNSIFSFVRSSSTDDVSSMANYIHKIEINEKC